MNSFKNIYHDIFDRKAYISVIGLGYVGMPLAVAFAKKANVIAFDICAHKVEQYKKGIDVTGEVGNDAIRQTTAVFTCNVEKLRQAKFHIITVPTPINADKTPNLKMIRNASRVVGANLTRESIVVFESTVYPGVTEEVCVPILEAESGLIYGQDFKVGYSPERINPGDRVNRLETIVKVVSGMDEDSLDTIAKVYELIIDAGVFRAQNIKVAEAAKVIENSQRDINIAFMNELSIILNKLSIDTKAVLEAAETKWNFMKFTPGLVGGHCIGVDPYYLTYKAQMMGYYSKIILSGRTINDEMARYVAEQTVKQLIKSGAQIKGAKVAVFGITFKEDCFDVRNSKVVDMISELSEYGIDIIIIDDGADKDGLKALYGLDVCNISEAKNVDACIFAVGHKQFRKIKLKDLRQFYKDGANVLVDIKGIFNKELAKSLGYTYWRL